VSVKKLLFGVSMLVGLVTLVAVGQAPSVRAEARFNAGDANYVAKDQTIDGNAYLAGNSVRVEGTINGDLFCAGSSIVVMGTVNGDVHCAGQTVVIGGQINGSLQIAGQNVTINGAITGSATAFGSTVTTETISKIGRDLTVGGQDVVLNGAVGRDVIGGASLMTINAAVGRDVQGDYQNLVISSNGNVAGILSYTSPQDAIISGQVAGHVQRYEAASYSGQRAVNPIIGVVTGALVMVLWTIMIALALALIAPKKMHTITTLSGRDLIIVFAIGFLALFVAPIIGIMLMITIVGLPLALIGLLAWLLLMLVSGGVTSYYIGRLLMKNLHPVASSSLTAGILALSFAIPVVNIITIIGSMAFGMGAALYAVRGEYQKPLHSVRLAGKAKEA